MREMKMSILACSLFTFKTYTIKNVKKAKYLLFGLNLKDANDLLCSTGICLSQSPAREHPNLQWTMCIKKNNTIVFKGCLIGLKGIGLNSYT